MQSDRSKPILEIYPRDALVQPSLEYNHFFLSSEPYDVPVIVRNEGQWGGYGFQLFYKDSEKEYELIKRKNPLEEKSAIPVELLATRNTIDISDMAMPAKDWEQESVSTPISLGSNNELEEPQHMVVKMSMTDMEIKAKDHMERESPMITHIFLGSNNKLVEQLHTANKDLNLLTTVYDSMDDIVSTSDRDFMVPNWVDKENAIYKQRSPMGNTVLHLAASYGNTQMVEKMAYITPELCTTINSNYDTPLHVAARAGHAYIIQCLLKAYLRSVRGEIASKHPQAPQAIFEQMLMVGFTLFQNNQGNTFFHEAFKVNSHNGAMIFRAFEASFITEDLEFEDEYKEIINLLAPFATNKEGESLLYLAIEGRCKDVVNQLLDICNKYKLAPQGISPCLPAIINRDIDILETILRKNKTWIHLKNEGDGRLPLHYAAFMGFHKGVFLFIKTCVSCAMERDKDGFFPIHLASRKGHVRAIKVLLKCCPDSTEFVDKNGRNILHTAAKSGKYQVVRHILKDPKLENMINKKDNNGDTPLHLATRHWHPKIVNAFTWDKRVKLKLLNHKYETALDIAQRNHNQNPTLPERLTWIALKSVDKKQSRVLVPSKNTQSSSENEAHDVSTQYKDRIDNPLKNEAYDVNAQYKDRINTLIVVSTLITTVSFTVGFTVPGDVDEGKAILLNHWAFHLFVFAITISMYGSISTTIILFLAQLQDLRLAIFALKCARPVLGISLASLSVAFLAGVYLVVSKLSWLATTFLFMAGFLVLVVVLLYILLWFPSPSTSLFLRYISYYPFLVLAWVAEPESESDVLPWVAEPGKSNMLVRPNGDSP